MVPRHDLGKLHDVLPAGDARGLGPGEGPGRVLGVVIPEVGDQEVGPLDAAELRVEGADGSEEAAF
jgi:hypothetical protein